MKRTMTNEEALEIITNAIQKDGMTREQDMALAIAQTALEKQIPKKAIVEKDKVKFRIICGNCPVCASSVYSKVNLFCPKCGQALDWSDYR